MTHETRGAWEERRTNAPRQRDRYITGGAVLPAWLPVAKRPEASMLLYHLSHHQPDHVGPYLERRRTEDIATVAAEAFEVIE